jgi:ribosomal protein L11 methyltransferase
VEWIELCVAVPAAQSEHAAGIANMAVPYGIYIEDYSDLEQGAREIANIDLIDEQLLKRDRTRAIIHLYISPDESPDEATAFLCERLSAAGIEHSIGINNVHEQDWANNWKQHYKPFDTGKKLTICPTWEDKPQKCDRAVLYIDPGMAFGTGEHDTTRLMLEAMESYIKGGEKVLDVGCGSGILSIAALLFGAKSTLGVDIDSLAVKTAIENGHINGFCPPQYKVIHGNLVDSVDGLFDIVVANIVADAIIMLSSEIRPFLKQDGVLIVSGIIEPRESQVKAALSNNGFKLIERRQSGGWLALVYGT